MITVDQISQAVSGYIGSTTLNYFDPYFNAILNYLAEKLNLEKGLNKLKCVSSKNKCWYYYREKPILRIIIHRAVRNGQYIISNFEIDLNYHDCESIEEELAKINQLLVEENKVLSERLYKAKSLLIEAKKTYPNLSTIDMVKELRFIADKLLTKELDYER